MKEQLEKIADHYGKDAQAVQCVEELNELAAAILKYRKRRFSEEFDHVIEEIADVEIMLEQIKYLYGIGSDFIDEIKQEKIDRQLARIEREEKTA
ncbi:hypothetical protein Ami103574_02465 [Aminipila butyrica]|uniref:NTP pyrophosphohydrolase MazG putative catalytic core domain-containing protein n=1 Tax=Aminipila butyrica TaxID=433296 RepID=A0A858BQY0_9FIRM|nr:hypothetical protein [Aminipila butyrica]QIB68243.1 hypothetical protein Ami103574_02465 [Aminipila butyrica]